MEMFLLLRICPLKSLLFETALAKSWFIKVDSFYWNILLFLK